MTVPAIISNEIQYLEDGVTLSFVYPYRFLASSDLVVRRRVVGAVDFVPVIGWSAVGSGDAAGGSVTLAASIAGATLSIRRETSLAQPTLFSPLQDSPAESTELSLDRVVMAGQDNKQDISRIALRALLVPEGDAMPSLPSALERKNKLLLFDAQGNVTVATVGQLATGAIVDALGGMKDAAASQSAVTIAIEDLGTPNLWQNPDLSQGNPDRVLVTNNALDAVGPAYWLAQQTGLNPFVAIQEFLNEDGLKSYRMTNGLPSFTENTIGTGIKTFDVGTGMNFAPGIDVTAACSSDLTQTMTGTVVSYVGSTLTLNIGSVTGAGTYESWSIGRIGTTRQAQTFKNTTAATNAGNVLSFADTTGIQIGSAIESTDANGIAPGAYVTEKTANTVTMSAAVTGGGVTAGQQITFYGDQGLFVYQDIDPLTGGAFGFGTPGARTSYLSFNVRSFGIAGTASLMFLGYNSLSTLGRSYATPFPVTTTETRVTVPLLGDTADTPGTWQIGYDATAWPWAALGFAWESQGTDTSRNIPADQWTDTPNVAGCDQQTFNLLSVVGAWVEVSAVKFGLDLATKFQAPAAIVQPVPYSYVRSPLRPYCLYEATRNPTGYRLFEEYFEEDGSYIFQALNDDMTLRLVLQKFGPDGTLYLPDYSDGPLSIVDGKVVSTQSAFTAYPPGAHASTGSPVFGAISGRYFIEGKRVFVQISVAVTTVGSGAGKIVVDLPTTASNFEWSLEGFDTGVTGNPIFGRIAAGQTVVQIETVSGAFPAQNGSVLNLSGFYEAA